MEGIKMKFNKNDLRRLILKEMADMSQFHSAGGMMQTPEDRDGYSDYGEKTDLITQHLFKALQAASMYPGHEDIKAVIESCLNTVESLVEV